MLVVSSSRFELRCSGGSRLCVYCGREINTGPGQTGGRRAGNRSYLLTRDRHVPGQTRFWVICCRDCVNAKAGLTIREWARSHPVGDHRRILLERLTETLIRFGVPESSIEGQGPPQTWEPKPLSQMSHSLAISIAGAHAAVHLGLDKRTCLTCHLPVQKYSTPPGGSPKSRIEAMLTRGHLLPSRLEGEIRRYWINQCHRCNTEQADLSIVDWYLELLRDGDRRAPLVEALLRALKSIGLRNSELTGRVGRDGRDDHWI